MNKNILIVVIAALIAVLGFTVLTSPEEKTVTEITATTPNAAEIETAAGEDTEAVPATEEVVQNDPAADATVAAEDEISSSATVDLEKAMAIRSVGSEDAPVVIEEFASLTCSHCAEFYINTYPKLKEAYIDTGKVRFIYHDFPLNAPALEGAIVARCLPEGRYFQFIKFLFETQDDWAFDRNFSGYIKQNAKLLGLGDSAHQACVGNIELREAVTARMQAQSMDYNIRSTPTFIINGEHQIVGARPFEAFQQVLDPMLEQSATEGNSEAE